MSSQERWQKWWFINGGNIHGLQKRRQTNRLADLAHSLSRAAWLEQDKEIEALKNPWQPIKSCPKDEEARFDVWAMDYEGNGYRFARVGRTKGGIFFAPFLSDNWTPTHWMKIPEGPKE